MTEPVETYDDGGALYEAGPFEVAAQPAGVNPGVVSIDGRSVTPHTARQLARVLEVAAARADPERPAEPDLQSIIDDLASYTDDYLNGGDSSDADKAARAGARAVERLRALTGRPAGLDPAYRTQES